MKIDPRLRFVLLTMALAFAGDLVSVWLKAGWRGAAFITFSLNLLILAYIWKRRDGLFARLFVFGLIVGFGELPTDYMAVAIQHTLVYAPGEPFIWKSPFYMPFSWTLVMVQFGYLALWMRQRWGLPVAMIATGLLGGTSLPIYECLAKFAGYWYYQNAPMVFFNTTPVYVIFGEFLLTVLLPFMVGMVEKARPGRIFAWGIVESVWIFISTVIAYKLFG